MFQELFTPQGVEIKDLTGWRRVVTNPWFATIVTVVLGVWLGMTGYQLVWPLFGAANQLLAALGLLAVCAWLGNAGRNNKMFYVPMGVHARRDADVPRHDAVRQMLGTCRCALVRRPFCSSSLRCCSSSWPSSWP